MGLIYLDTCLVIYAVENHPEFALPVLSAMAGQPSNAFASHRSSSWGAWSSRSGRTTWACSAVMKRA
jgi:hypothetical protein